MHADLTLFAKVATRPEAELDLGLAALLIAEPEYPTLDLSHYLDVLDQLGARARARLGGHNEIDVVLQLLFRELGFRGNRVDYYDPRNSFINEVLDRRTGIPITLAVVTMEVCARAGVPAQGIPFPGHFLLRGQGAGLIDPFDGKPLSPDALQAIYTRASGGEARPPDPRLLEPATKSQILIRMLNNLRAIYIEKGERGRLRAVLERLQLLEPSEEVRRQLESLGTIRPPFSGGRLLN